MRDAGPGDCALLFRSESEVLLPDGSVEWAPPCDANDLTACMRHLRQCKLRGLRHVIWWELGLHGDIERSYLALAEWADGLLEQALEMSERLIAPRYGRLEGGRFCVTGLGKLGGGELNLGSDVDLLFIWQGEGETQGGHRCVPAAEYFGHLSRMLIRLMSERTADGIVWPVDMRLRPGGGGAPIALSLDATLNHYRGYGQTWERAMLLKSRPVAGDTELGQAFVEGVTPFVYRRYLDYTTVQALADMKRRIRAQAGGHEIDSGFDVKRGEGGIREIEFFIQSLQLLHGGRNAELRAGSSLGALRRLHDAGIVGDEDAMELEDAYRFWRRVEHALQARKGEQTHRLPSDYAAYLQQALAVEKVDAALRCYAAAVSKRFREQFAEIEAQTAGGSWLDKAVALPEGMDEDSRERVRAALARIDVHLRRGLLPDRSRRQVEHILEQAVPVWLDDTNGVQALNAFADLLHKIAGRATWIDLLATHKGTLRWLIGVLSASRYVAGHVAANP